MKCKIDHEEDGAIPKILCATCNPRVTISPPKEDWPPPEEDSDSRIEEARDRLERKAKRRLRAEVKMWRSRIEAMNRTHTDPRDIAKAEAILTRAETDLYMVA